MSSEEDNAKELAKLRKLLAHSRCGYVDLSQRGSYRHQCSKNATHFFPLHEGLYTELAAFCEEHASAGLGGHVPYHLSKKELERYYIEGLDEFREFGECPDCDGKFRYVVQGVCDSCGHTTWDRQGVCRTCFGTGQVRKPVQEEVEDGL